MKDVHSWVQPRRIAALGLIELLDLLLEHGENGASRTAGFKPVGEWVREKILFRAFFIRIQGIIKNLLEVRRCGSRVSVRHNGEVKN